MHVLGDRYQLGEPIAVVARSNVWHAQDTWTGARVVAKQLPDLLPADRQLWRREVVAHAASRIRGVVPLIDDVHQAGDVWLISPFVDGEHFPVIPGKPRSYFDIERTVLDLLDVLASVHYRGVRHCDVKPANVLVSADGSPHLLDLGFAVVRQYGTMDSGVGMNLAYAAPEQIQGHEPGPTADVFAVALMVVSALRGKASAGDDIRARLRGDVQIDDLADALPARVSAALRAMLARDPKDRPQDGAAAAEALGRPRPRVAPALLKRLPDPASEADLAALFHRPSPFLRLEDGAALLHARTGGDHVHVDAEIDSWVRSGHASFHDGLVFLPREALRALTMVVQDSADVGDLLHHADVARRAGDPEGALPSVLAAAHRAGHAGDEAAHRQLLVTATNLVAGLQHPALWTIVRAAALAAPFESPETAGIAELLRVLISGWHRTESPLLREQAFEDDELECWRQAWQCVRADHDGGAPALDRQLQGLKSWATTPLRQARLAGWLGLLRYRQLRFDEAAECHAAVAHAKDTPRERQVPLGNQAEALQSGGRWEAAAALCREALPGAIEQRDALSELRLCLVLRAAERRLGVDHPPDAGHVLAAAAVHPRWGAQVAVIEAGEAWRRGQREQAAQLARMAGRATGGLGLLIEALVVPDDPAAVMRRALAAGMPTIALQVAHILRDMLPSDSVRDAVLISISQVPAAYQHVSFEVCSPLEALHPWSSP